MKPLTKTAKNLFVALALLSFAGAPFAQDEVEEEGGGWFSGVTGFFSNLFGGDDEGEAEATTESEESAPMSGGAIEWYGGADLGVTKSGSRALHSSSGSYSAYGGGIFANRLGLELGYLDMGDADIRGGGTLGVNGFRGGLTYSTEAGDAPVRVGLGLYTVDAEVAGFSESSRGAVLGVKFEQAVTQSLYLTLGTDLFFGIDLGGGRSDAIMFGIGLAFHSAPPAPAEAEEDAGVEVTEPAYEDAADSPAEAAPEAYETPAYEEAPAEATDAAEPAAEDAAVEEPAAEESYE